MEHFCWQPHLLRRSSVCQRSSLFGHIVMQKELWELSLSSQLITGWLRLKTVAVRFCISRVIISKEIFVLLSGVTGPVFRERCMLTAVCAVLPVLPVLIGLLAIVTAVCSLLLTGWWVNEPCIVQCTGQTAHSRLTMEINSDVPHIKLSQRRHPRIKWLPTARQVCFLCIAIVNYWVIFFTAPCF